MDFSHCHLCDHRQRPVVNGRTACNADPERRDITTLVPLGLCHHPEGPRFTLDSWPPPPRGKIASQIEVRGPKLWAELHQRPREWPGGDDTEWLNAFALRLPCGDCRKHFLSMLLDQPADFSSPAAYFASTHRWHNVVSARLGKPELTLDEAKREWGV